MVARSLLLGIDAGTSSVKASIFTTGGELIAVGSAPVESSHPSSGWVEQSPSDIWSAATAAIRSAMTDAGALPEEVRGVGTCGHSPTLILLDSAGEPVRPAILWQDTRAGDSARELAGMLGDRWAEVMGARFPVNHSFAAGRLLWLRRHEPTALDRAAAAVEPKDYVAFRLTGVVATDVWAAKSIAHLQTGRFIDEWREMLGIAPGLLPRICQPDEAMGYVTDHAAASLGLCAGTPVATGWTDGICTMLGTGIYGGEGVAFLSSGTSDVVGNVAPGAATGGIDVLEAPAPGNRRVSLGQSQTGGASLMWFAQKFADGDVERVLRMAESVAPGAGGLVFLPYLQGERAPIWDDRARGVFFGMTMEHGPAEFARAVLEGVAACDRHLTESVARSSGQPIERLRPAGGARGGLWIQIKADMLGKPLELTSEQPATLGAAMLGGVAAGVWPDLEAATRDVVRVTGTIAPNPANRAVYDRLYETYVALYPRVKDLFPR